MPTAKEATTPSLVAKLAEIMGEMARIPKEGFNKAQSYRFVRETDVAEKASALLAAKHIWIHQTLLREKMKPLYTTASGSQMWLTKVWVAFQFIDGDSPLDEDGQHKERTEPQTFVGYGADTGDKGVYKAMTGAEKYFLMKSFLVSTGDDPEADEKVDKAAAAAGAAAGVKVVRGSQAGVQRGGRSSRATAAQVAEIARLAGKAGLDAETTVPVVERVTGTTAPEGKTMREWLASLTGQQASEIIAALEALVPVQEETASEDTSSASEATDIGDGPSGAEEPEQEAFSVV